MTVAPPAPPLAAPAPRLRRIVPALGVAQIVAWGTLYYSVAILAAPMSRSLGIAEPLVFGAFSLGLVMSGAVAPYAGRCIDARGGRPVLLFASIAAALGFLGMALSAGAVGFVLSWSMAGVAMGCGLYDAVLAALIPLAPGPSYRRAVTALTLFGGFASTVFWPLSYALEAAVGWRATCVIFACLHVGLCVPLYRLALPQRPRAGPAPLPETHPPAPLAARGAAFRWLATAFALSSFTFSVLAAHLIVLLDASGIARTDAILVGALIGPMQVLARIVEFALARNLRAVTIGTVSFALMFVALCAFPFIDGQRDRAYLFAALYGASNGIMTIVRGTVPIELFGRNRIGALLGRLALPSFFAKALAPAAFSLLLAYAIPASDAVVVLTAAAGMALFAFLRAGARADRKIAPGRCG